MSADNRLEQAMANIDAGNGEGLGLLDMLNKASDGMTADQMEQFKAAVLGDKEMAEQLGRFVDHER